MQAGPVMQLAAVLPDVGRGAPGATPSPRRASNPAGETPSGQNAPQQETFSLHHDHATDPRPERHQTSGPADTGVRRDGDAARPAPKRRAASGPRGGAPAPNRDRSPLIPDAPAATWARAVKAALQQVHGLVPGAPSGTAAGLARKQPLVVAADGKTHVPTPDRVPPMAGPAVTARGALGVSHVAPKTQVSASEAASAGPPGGVEKRGHAVPALRLVSGARVVTAKAVTAAPKRMVVPRGEGRAAKPVPSDNEAVSRPGSPVAAVPPRAPLPTASSARLVDARSEAGRSELNAAPVGRSATVPVSPTQVSKTLDGSATQASSSTVQAKATQPAVQGVSVAVQAGAREPVAGRRGARESLAARLGATKAPDGRPAAPVDPALRTSGSGAPRTGSPKAMSSLRTEGESQREAGGAAPAVKRAVAVFEEVAAAATRQSEPSRGKTSMAAKALTVEQVGGQVVVSRGKVQAPAPVVSDVAASGVAAQGPGTAQGRAAVTPMPPAPVAGEVADQVAESIRVSGAPTGRQIIVQLRPPDLGRVRIIFRSEGEAVRGVVRVDNPETLSRLEREAAPLMQRLQSSGIEVRRLDVMLSSSHDGDVTQNPAFREGQDRPNGWVTDDRPGLPAGERFGDAGRPADEPETQDPGALVGSGAVNVRI